MLSPLFAGFDWLSCRADVHVRTGPPGPVSCTPKPGQCCKSDHGNVRVRLWGGRPRPRRTPWSGCAVPERRPTWASAAGRGPAPLRISLKVGENLMECSTA